jgi:hypothetical protein
LFYGNISAFVGITFAALMKGFICFYIGKNTPVTRHGFSDRQKGLANTTGGVCVFLIGLTSRAVFVIIAA